MAEEGRMTVADVVANVLSGEHGDFVREAVAIVARDVDGGGGVGGDRRRPRRGVGGAADVSEWLPAVRLGDAGG